MPSFVPVAKKYKGAKFQVHTMFRFSKKTDYGLTFLLKLAKQHSSQPATLTKIADANRLPKSFLAKIATDLVRAQIIKSKEGVKGGYFLAKKPEDITLDQVLVALESTRRILSTCNSYCLCQFCTKRDVAAPLEEEIQNTLKKKTLADFLTPAKKTSSAFLAKGGEVNA